MNTNFSHSSGVIYAPQKAIEISNFMNEQRENGLMYAPKILKRDVYSMVEIFDERGYSIGYL